MAQQFTEQERHILQIVQSNLPNSATPYADIAHIVGCSEEEVLQLLQRLKDDGTIRRFGASIKHQKTGWNNNAMVAWKVSEEQIEDCGQKAAEHSHVSHCYHRPSSAADWPFTLYTMVHGRSEEECQNVIREIQTKINIQEYAVLDSIKELKKISMTYF